MSEHSVWAGLSQRGDAPAAGEQDAFDRAPMQRTVDAATAPPLQLDPTKNPFTSWRRPGSPAPCVNDEEPAADTENDEESMATRKTEKKARKPRAAKPNNPQFQICTVLLAGDRTREELLADVSATRTAFNGGLFNAKAAERIQFIEKTAKYHLTAVGRAWVTGAAIPPKRKGDGKATVPPPKPTTKRKATKAAKARKAPAAAPVAPPAAAVTVVDTRPTPPRTFRCAVISDGGFFLEKDGQRIDLEPDEHAWMLRYLDRMAAEA